MDNENFPKRNLPRDVFLHLLAIVTLYWSSISFVTLLWQFINYYFPDILKYYYQGSFNGPMRFAIASLIIVFPVFLIISWYLNNIYRREAAVRESKIRKWLIYLTLFITSLIIIGDLVSTINTFLEGEMTVRFILKAVSVLFVAVVIFWYYLDDVRRDVPTKLARYFAIFSAVIVLIGIISAFFIVGSPNTARLMEIDQQKVTDLEEIQNQIVGYWQKKETLPSSLSDLNDKISGFSVPVDPQTKSIYEYNIKDLEGLSFELCATFNKEGQRFSSSTYLMGSGMNQNWNHGVGRVCFERIIDREIYPPISNIK